MNMSQIEEIKNKIDVVDLISEYIQLKQAGANWKACCPFHNEKTPSFMASREKQIWHCFGCGEGGDIYTFVQKIEGMEFGDALKFLAQKAGVQLKQQDPKLISQKSRITDINKLAADVYHRILTDVDKAKIARDYIEKRGLTPETVELFQLGYSPDSWDFMIGLLRKKGYSDQEILLSGLAVNSEKGKGIYDRFRGRLMFPIWNTHGSVVGFTARILDETKENQGGKYVNTPQTLIYNKSFIIYGMDKARQEIKAKDCAVMVEGNMDVIASHQAGVKNVIASSGTAMTIDQLKNIQRFSNNLAIAFDIDEAGQMAAEKGIDNALSLGMNIKVVQLPEQINGKEVKDPDDCIAQGKEHWEQAISDAIGIMDYHFEKVFSIYDKNKAEHKKRIAAELLKQISKLNDTVDQDAWITKLSQKLDVPESILRETMRKYLDARKKEPEKQDILFVDELKKPREYLLSEHIIALICKYPQFIEYVVDSLTTEMIVDNSLQELYKEIILYYNTDNIFEYSEFEKYLLKKNQQLVTLSNTLLLLADKDFFNFTESEIKSEINNIIKALKTQYITSKIRQVQDQLSSAEEQKDQKRIDELATIFAKLTNELSNINN